MLIDVGHQNNWLQMLWSQTSVQHRKDPAEDVTAINEEAVMAITFFCTFKVNICKCWFEFEFILNPLSWM